MDQSNPYEAPRDFDGSPSGGPAPITLERGFAIVLASGFGFATVGAGLGYLLGRLIPEYYRGVFAASDDPGFDPVRVGLGLGLTQGLICGLIVGAVVVQAVVWAQRLSTSRKRPEGRQDEPITRG